MSDEVSFQVGRALVVTMRQVFFFFGWWLLSKLWVEIGGSQQFGY